jgi:hypothetical protein
VDLQWLRKEKRFGEVEQAIQAYLKYHGKRAEPWMYLLLAVSFEVNGRGEKSIREALGWAGYLARDKGDAFTLIEVADVMLVRDMLEIPLPRDLAPVDAGALLEKAADMAPQRPEPVLLLLLMAEKTRDAKRMADAVGRLMSLGWPGFDEQWRLEARRKAEELAKELERDGRDAEANSLLASVAGAEARDLYVRLTWSGNAGLDLAVEEPLGATATVLSPRTVFGGAVVKSGRGKHPESVYVCPLGFDGDYKIRVETLYNDEANPARDITLEVITHEGAPDEKRQSHSITPSQTEPIVVRLEGGRRKTALPYSAPAKIVMVPEGQDAPKTRTSPSTGTPVVQPPDASEAADLLRNPSSPAAKKGRSGGGSIKVEPRDRKPAGGAAPKP